MFAISLIPLSARADCQDADSVKALGNLSQAEEASKTKGILGAEQANIDNLREMARDAKCSSLALGYIERETSGIYTRIGDASDAVSHLTDSCDLEGRAATEEEGWDKRNGMEDSGNSHDIRTLEFSCKTTLLKSLIDLGRLSEAMTVARQSHDLAAAYDFDTATLATDLLQTEMDALSRGESTKAAGLHEALGIVATGDVKREVDMVDLAQGSTVDLMLGEYDSAIRKAARAHDLLETLPDVKRSPEALAVLDARGTAFCYLGEPEQALKVYEEGDTLVAGIQQQAAGEPHGLAVADFQVALFYRGMTEAELMLGRPGDADATLDKALKAAKTSGLTGLDVFLLGRVRAEIALSSPDSKEVGLSRARQIMVDSNDLAGQWLLDLEIDKTLTAAQIDGLLRQTPSILESLSRDDRVALLSHLAAKYADRQDYVEAAKRYAAAIEQIEEGRLHAWIPDALRDFFADEVGVYDGAIDTLYVASRQRASAFDHSLAPFGASYAEAAFRFADAAHARRFSDLYGPAILERFGLGKDIPEAVRQHAQVLRDGLTLEVGAIDSGVDLGKVREHVDQATREYLAYIDTLNPGMAALAYPRPLTLQSLPKSLDGLYIILYKVTDSAVYWWLVFDGKLLDFERSDMTRDELRKDVHNFIADIDDTQPVGSVELFDSLVRSPFAQIKVDVAANPKAVPRVVVVPDDALYLLPWDALPGVGGGRLGENFVISYAPSVVALVQSINASSPRRGTALVVGDVQDGTVSVPTDAGTKRLEELQSDETESTIATLKDAGLKVDELTGPDASPGHLLDTDESGYDIIHFDTHAFAETLSPPPSLLLHPDGDSPYGLLDIADIPSLHLRAHLITLSACDSGKGAGPGSPAMPGEGIESLASAFMLAGSRATLASLWDVSSAKTPLLMREFYSTSDGRNQDFAMALYSAKRKLRAQGYPPSVWAAFVLIGDPAP